MLKVLYFRLKKLGSFEFELLVGDITLGAGRDFYGLRHQALGPNHKREPLVFFTQTLGGNLHLWSP